MSRVVVERSGLVESFHEVAAVAVDPSGRIVATTGQSDELFFIRSAAKPFQAMVCETLGGEMPDEWLAVAGASHDADPVHLAVVNAILGSAGLDESHLRTPPARAGGAAARSRDRTISPLRHNCSGKHAAMLRACRRQGWEVEGYLDPNHPLQSAITQEMTRLFSPLAIPVGVDGCGAPVFRCTVASLATGYAALLTPGYRRVLNAMMRYPALVSGWDNYDAVLARTLGAAAKRGAEACLGAVLPGRGALAIKIWDGDERRALPVALLAVLRSMGWIPNWAGAQLEEKWSRPVLGRGRPVGTVRAEFEMEFA